MTITRREAGFTLIELSIVLVIIGLLVGGILLGRDMIKAAEVRATIGQFEKYTTATNAFRMKYNYLPGDMPATVAGYYGFFAETTLGNTVGHQDGNWLLEGGAAQATTGVGETLSYWRHLSDAQLIDGIYGSTVSGNAIVTTTGLSTSDETAGTIHRLFPRGKTGKSSVFIVASFNGVNLLQLTGMLTFTSVAGTYGPDYNLLPIEAFTIDSKVDDGKPLQGRMNISVKVNNVTMGAVICYGGGTEYNVSDTSISCSLSAQMK